MLRQFWMTIPAGGATDSTPAHPHVQGAYASWLGIMPVSSPKNIQFPCVEMNRQFLVYGGHTLSGAWVLTLQCPDGLHVRLSSPVCHGRVFSLDFTIVCVTCCAWRVANMKHRGTQLSQAKPATAEAWKVLDIANHKTAQELIRHLEALRNSRL